MKKLTILVLLLCLALPTLALANAPSPFNQGHVAALEATGLDAKAILATYGTPQLVPAHSDAVEESAKPNPIPFDCWLTMERDTTDDTFYNIYCNWTGVDPLHPGQTLFYVDMALITFRADGSVVPFPNSNFLNFMSMSPDEIRAGKILFDEGSIDVVSHLDYTATITAPDGSQSSYHVAFNTDDL